MGTSGDTDDGDTESTDDNDDVESNNNVQKRVTPTKAAAAKTTHASTTPKKAAGSSTPKKPGSSSAKGAPPVSAVDEDDYGGSTDVDSDREGGQAESSDTEDEIRRVQEGKTTGKAKKGGDSDDAIYDADTDVDADADDVDGNQQNGKVDTSHLDLPKLPNLFRGKGFFLYGTFDTAMRRLLTRYITAFDGKVEDYMGDKISFVVTQSEWDDHFDEALEENPSLSFVKPRWIFACSDKRRLVPHQPFSVMPNDLVDD